MTDKPSEMVERIGDAMARLKSCTDNECTLEDMARAALSAIEGMGYVIVPRKPTKEMLEQGAESLNDGDTLGCKYLAETAYYAMLSAALAERKRAASPPKA